MSSKAKMLRVVAIICAVGGVAEIILLAVGYQPVNVKNVGTIVVAAVMGTIFFMFSRKS
jgi:hypothetical protein